MDPTTLLGAWLIVSLPPAEPDASPPAPTPSDEGYRTVVVEDAESATDAQRRVDANTPGFGTAVVVETDDPTLRGDDLGDRVRRQTGATTRSIGGLGQYSAVSLRGSSPQQVPVFVDGVPIDGAMAGLVDLSSQPLDTTARIEIYRGYVPIEFGRGGLGGAINLVGRVHRGPTRLRAKAGYGSFAARYATAAVAGELGPRASGSIALGYAGAKGDFPYFDNNGTPIFRGDDTTTRRTNNAYDRLSAVARIDGRRDAWRYSSQVEGLGQIRGVPGSATIQSTRTSDESTRVRSVSSLRRGLGRPGGKLVWVGGATVEWRRFRDPLGEVGISIDDEVGRSLDGYLSPRLRLPLWTGAFLGLSGDLRAEQVDIDERSRIPDALYSGDAVRRRVGVGTGLELEQFAFARRVHVVPALRADALINRFEVPAGEGELSDEGVDSDLVALSPRLGARVRIIESLSLRGSVGRYFRPPTLMEMFGDRGFIIGNESLEPERGVAVDGGLVFDATFDSVATAYAHVAGFGVRNEDGIQWVQSGSVVRPENLVASRIVGLESSLRVTAWRDRIVLDAAYTWIDSADLTPDPARHRKPLPGRPRHDLYASISLAVPIRAGVDWVPRARYAIEHVSGTFLDPSGRYGLPPRTLHSVGLETTVAGRVRAGVDLRNLADVRMADVTPQAGPPTPYPVPVSDFIGFPLPGRSVWVSLGVDFVAPFFSSPATG